MRMKLTINSLLENVGRFTGIILDPNIRYKYSSPLPRRRRPVARKYRLFTVLFFFALAISAQMKYDNFEGSKYVIYYDRNGVLDTLAANPAPSEVNNSAKCALYIRNRSKKFDNIKMKLPAPLVDVSNYATHLGEPPRLKMKLYTTAPVGTLVEILLGSHGRNTEYPAGTNSQYQAHTTKTNEWEELVFIFSQIPQGSETATTEADQVTLLFNPNSLTSDKYYFDEITGPALSGTVMPLPSTSEQPPKKEANSTRKTKKKVSK